VSQRSLGEEGVVSAAAFGSFRNRVWRKKVLSAVCLDLGVYANRCRNGVWEKQVLSETHESREEGC
jgi:hypothetical protein